MLKKTKNLITGNPRKTALLVVILAVVLWLRKPRASTANPNQSFFDIDMTVGTGNLETVLTIKGTTKFADSQKLTFMGSKGKVKTVNVKVGDLVKKGQTLASMTTDDLDDQVTQARINLDDAKQSLQDLLDGYNLQLELLQQQANYDALILKQRTIDQDQALALEELKQKIEDATKTYTDTKADYEELLSGSNSATADLALSSTIRSRNTTFQTAVYDLKSAVLSLQTTLDTFDQLLVLSDKYKYLEKNIYIGAKDPNFRNQSESAFWAISAQVASLNTLYTTLEKLPVQDLTNEQLLQAYSTLKEIGNAMMSWGDVNYNMFKASIESNTFTLEKINGYATTYGTNIQSQGIKYVQQYTTMVEKLANLKEDTSLEDTKLKMNKAKTNLDKLNMSIDTTLATQAKEKAQLQSDIDTVQRNIAKINGGQSLNESKIKQAKNSVTQRQNSLNSLLDKYEDYKLTANFDGVITQMDIQVGDSIDNSSNSTVKYLYVENNNVLEMTLSVEQVDIIKLKVGMEVVVYLDAYTSSTYQGLITEINTVPTSAGNLTTYEVTITFEKNTPDEVILAGMGGNAKIIMSQTKNVMVVPNQAISRKDGKNVVMLWKNNAWADQEIEI
ncbi:MAG: HlyD family efflux transporter periplasmic adaptor subunit [Candidatus Peribacteria bacterium]|jgi:multidrug efflux pump subunit AcrA (membrane-fusion protein)|nr:HlyD family efflux transporter periplasmic adaptor subunit [Candidatus Peribacteria bacterium]